MQKSFVVAVALTVTALFASADVASAASTKKKISYEEAWKRCTAEVDKAVPRDWQSQRQARGAACMKKYGYKL